MNLPAAPTFNYGRDILQNRTSAFTHTAPTLDGWRGSVRKDKDAERGVLESSAERSESTDPTVCGLADCGGSGSAATNAEAVGRRRLIDRCYQAQRSSC